MPQFRISWTGSRCIQIGACDERGEAQKDNSRKRREPTTGGLGAWGRPLKGGVMARFKIACYRYDNETGRRLGGWYKKAVTGELLCDGLFGIEDDSKALTHIPTGRVVAHFSSKQDARDCASELARLDLPWEATTAKAWLAGLGNRGGEIRYIIRACGGR